MILTVKQEEKLDNVIREIRDSLSMKMVNRNSRPVFFEINMNQGGFRSITETRTEVVKQIQL